MTLNCEKIWLEKGSKGSQVTELQTMLKSLGYYTSVNGRTLKIDGDFGQYTDSAVRAFQKATGNVVDGKVGPVTCKSLNEKAKTVTSQNKTDGTAGELLQFDCGTISLRRNSGDVENVKKLQIMLKELGYYVAIDGYNLKVDGIFGEYTEKALKAFQTDTGHDNDGWLASKTCPDLNKKYKELKTKQANATKAEAAKQEAVVTTPKVDPLAIDPKKEQVSYPEDYWYSEPNFYIEGIGFIAETWTPTNGFKEPQWKTLELMSGKTMVYQGHNQLREYDVTVHIHRKYFDNSRNTIKKMLQKVVTVTSTIKGFISGQYVISKMTYKHDKGEWFEYTFHFIEVEP